jgi:hypothetical protein
MSWPVGGGSGAAADALQGPRAVGRPFFCGSWLRGAGPDNGYHSLLRKLLVPSLWFKLAAAAGGRLVFQLAAAGPVRTGCRVAYRGRQRLPQLASQACRSFSVHPACRRGRGSLDVPACRWRACSDGVSGRLPRPTTATTACFASFSYLPCALSLRPRPGVAWCPSLPLPGLFGLGVGSRTARQRLPQLASQASRPVPVL